MREGGGSSRMGDNGSTWPSKSTAATAQR